MGKRTKHAYVELHARSAFSFLRASSLPTALTARAAEVRQPPVLDGCGSVWRACGLWLRTHDGRRHGFAVFGPRLDGIPEPLPVAHALEIEGTQGGEHDFLG